ncbi:MAG: lamin tail domain-containing protein [Deltaproteobacteria bacterium]|nr:lamin tail domain-containing protein [Deltaproteobacteria bacterium]
MKATAPILSLVLLSACVAPAEDPLLSSEGAPRAIDIARQPTIVADGLVELYFTRPGVDSSTGEDPELDDAVALLFDEAQTSIDLCLFEFDRQFIVDALLDANDRGITIRFVGDADEEHDDGYEELAAAGIDLSLRRPNDRIMHNKFAVIDGSTVWTGSANFSENGILRNNNGSMLLHDPDLAAHYQAEFDQMFSDELFGRRKVAVEGPGPLVLGDTEIVSYFSPRDEPHIPLLAALDEADQTVLFMIFAFTRLDVADQLIALHEDGVQVVGVFDESQARGRYSVDEKLAQAGVPVFIDGNHNSIGFAGGKLHHKTMIIDPLSTSEPTVSVGSYNWSNAASHYNDENMLVMSSAEIAAAYTEEFCAILDSATIHPDYSGTVPDPCASLLKQVRVNEFLANPEGADAGKEWVELVNLGGAPVDLDGWTLSDTTSVRHAFADTVLEAGRSLVVEAGSVGGIPGATAVATSGALSLGNSKDQLVLRDADDSIVDRVAWTAAAPGVSFNRNEDGDLAGNFVLHTTLPGAVEDSSPGLTASGGAWGPTVIVNELMPNPAGTDSGNEWVELVNTGNASVDLTGWTLGDTAEPDRHVFSGTLGPDEALVLFDSGSHPEVPGSLTSSSGSLSLNNSNETLTLRNADGIVVDTVAWTASTSGVSLNRVTDADPAATLIDHDTVLGASGTSSPDARVDGSPWGQVLVVNEVMPNPAGSDSGNEYVEIVNLSDAAASLDGWTLGDAVSATRHVFDSTAVIPPGGVLVVYDRGDHSAIPGALNSSSGTLSLNNAADTVRLLDGDGVARSVVGWSGAPSGVSLNRGTDGDPDALLVDHSDVPGASGDSSPGTQVDGTSW